MTETTTLNMIQLNLQEGMLSLKTPIQHTTDSPQKLAEGLQELLAEESCSHLIFFTTADRPLRVDLSQKGIRIVEKSRQENREYVFIFASQKIRFNKEDVDSSFFPIIADKIEQLMRELKADTVRIFKKQEGL